MTALHLAGEVAKRLGIHRQTLKNWIRLRKIKPKRDKLSGYYYWTDADLKAIKKARGRCK